MDRQTFYTFAMYYIAAVISCFIILIYLRKKKISIRQKIAEIGYEIYYYILGARGILEDHVYYEFNKTELPRLEGYVAIVTGGARGIGTEVVKKLLQCDMNVVIACRDLTAGDRAVERIRMSGITSGEVLCYRLDMASMLSIKTFAKIITERFSKIDILINNAGVMFVPLSLTGDGFESHFAINYLGHCYLTHLLMPALIAAGGQRGTNSRIVNVSSCAHLAGSIHFDDLYMSSHYIPSAAYAQSKLAQIIFTKTLDEKFREHNLPIQTHAVHPGIVDTDLFNGTFLKTYAPWLPHLIFKTPEQGAISIVHAAVSPLLEGRGGTYISNCRETHVSPLANSQDIQDKLWTVMQSLLKIQNFGSVLD